MTPGDREDILKHPKPRIAVLTLARPGSLGVSPGSDGRETYLEMMRFNTEQMARALDGDR